jgi:adenylate cyclase
LGAALSALLTLLLGLALYFSKAGEWAIFLSYDIPFAIREREIPTNAVIIYLDDASHNFMNQLKNQPWDRSLHANLLQRLTDAGASAVVFDMIFSDPWVEKPDRKVSKSTDEIFADAIRTNGRVVLGGSIEHEGKLVTTDKPLPILRNAAADWGLVHYHSEALGPRQHLETIEELPSLSWAAAKIMQAPVTKNSTQDAVRRWINYYGPPGSLPSISYMKAYDGRDVDPDFFRNKAVFIGSRQTVGLTGAGKDEFPTAFTWYLRTHSPGVEIHATVFLNLLRQDWLTRFPKWAEIFLIVLFGVGAGFGLSTLYSRLATAAALLAGMGVLLAAWIFFRYQLVWFAWLILLAELLFALIWSWGYNSIQAYAERKILEHSLALHLPARRVKQILKSPELLAPSAEKQEVSLMFTDIADWSTISDRVAPDRLFKHLNRYFEKTIPCVHKEDGMVLQLIGDAIFALWNAPEPQPNHQERACAAALKLRDELVEFESGNENYPLRTRVGLHCGPVSVGNCGSAERLVYTALGAETNMAARLEGLNKYLGTQILASDRIVTEAVEEKFTWRCMGRFKLKGSDRVLEIYELLDTRDKEEHSRAWRKLFSNGLRHFQHQEWEEAVAAFSQVILERKEDGPSRFYLRKIEAMRQEKLPEKWFGEISMDEK